MKGDEVEPLFSIQIMLTAQSQFPLCMRMKVGFEC